MADEYLARLGIDTGDMRRAIEQTITLLGELEEHFGSKIAGATGKASAALEKVGKSAEESGGRVRSSAGAQDVAAKSTDRLANSADKAARSLPRLRYAMYDVSVFAGTMGAALAAGGVLIERTAVQYEQAFASVARTAHIQGTQTGQDNQLRTLRNDLVNLSTQIPVTYADITKIATLGNQLDIPAADLSSFTKTVAQFSASTNVSVDASATAFGRLGQIFNTTNYRGIGDDIAYLGVNAVATESDIIKVAGQIAVSANAYGYSEKQTLALATAYASLGVKAESARGTTVRAFSQIGAASAMGGAKLDEIAKVSGMTTAGFKKAWETDASGAFTRFVSGLGKYGANAKSVLTDLGITASRDTTNLLLLAQNSNVLTKAQDDATHSAGALNTMFARQTDTVSARLQLAQNNVNALFSDIGQTTSGPVKGALDLLNSLVGMIDHLAHDPLAAGGLAITVGIVTLAGALLLAVAGWTQFRANLLAVATVQETLGNNTRGLDSVYQILFGSLTKTTAATNALTAAQAGNNAAAATTAAATGNATAATEALSIAEARAGVNAAELDLALAQQSGDMEVVAMSAAALEVALSAMQVTMATLELEGATAARAEALLAKDIAAATAATADQTEATVALTAARARQTAAIETQAAVNAASAEGRAAETLATNTAASATGKLSGILGKAGLIGTMLAFLPMIPSMVSALGDWGDQMSGTQKDADSLTKSILGLSDAAAHKQSAATLATASDYITSSTGGANNTGFLQGGFAGLNNAYQGPRITNARLVYNQRTTGQNVPGKNIGFFQGGGALNKNQQETSDQLTSYDQALSSLVQGGHLKEAKAGFDQITKGMAAQDKSAKVLAVLFPQLSSALGVTAGKTIQTALAGKTATTSAQQQAKAYSQIIANAFGVGSAQTAVQKSLNTLGKTFVTSGIHATIYGGSLQKVIASILAEAGSGPQAASQMQTLFETLVKGGYASAAQLAPLQAVIRGLNGGKDAAASALPGLDSLATGYNDAAAAANKQAAAAAKSAAATEKQARTLKDYGSDLSNVFGDQLDYAFGVQKALDDVNSKWRDISQREKDAVAQIKEYRAQLNLLNQGKSDDQFYLGIANRYGDTRRAADLRADLAQKNSQITSTQKQLNDAQTQGSKALKGNSAAAIQNRSSLYDMIDGYKGYISSLATSGASQATLTKAIADSKQQFIDQATQIGFSRRDVADLATQFDGFAKVVRAVPRGITTKIGVNTTAADKAIAAYKENLDKLKGKTVSGGTIIAPKVQHPSKQSKAASEAAALMGEIAGLTAALASPNKPRNGFVLQGMANQLQDYREQLAHLGGFRSGGWTGDGSPNEVAGLVHGREFVLNQTGAQMIPRAELEAANQGRAPYMAGSKAPKMVMPSNLTVSLSQMDRLLLGQNPAVQVGISPDAFGAAIDGAFLRAGQLGAN